MFISLLNNYSDKLTEMGIAQILGSFEQKIESETQGLVTLKGLSTLNMNLDFKLPSVANPLLSHLTGDLD